MEDKKGFAVPPLVATAAGLAVGGFFGQNAGEAIADVVTPHLPSPLNEHAGTLTHLTQAATAFGGAMVGHMLAVEKPAEAVVLALAAAPTLLGKVQHEHETAPAVAALPTVTAGTLESDWDDRWPYTTDDDGDGAGLVGMPTDVMLWPDSADHTSMAMPPAGGDMAVASEPQQTESDLAETGLHVL